MHCEDPSSPLGTLRRRNANAGAEVNVPEMAVSDSSEAPPPTSRSNILHYENLVRLMVRLSEQCIRSQRKREDRSGDCEAPTGCAAEWTGDDLYFLKGGRAGLSSNVHGHGHGNGSGLENQLRRCKRQRIRLDHSECSSSSSQVASFDCVPDEILTDIFRYIPGARDRSSCASVCKRWLTLQTKISRDDFQCQGDGPASSDESDGVVNQPATDLSRSTRDLRLEKQPLWAIGDLCRLLEGKKATDLRLAAIAVGTGAHGGLGKLTIRGGPGERSAKGVTDEGLAAIGTCCNALRSLTLWDCPNVGNEALKSIGAGCRLLENLDLLKCPNVGDAGLQAVAAGCIRLSGLSLESCERVGNVGVRAIAENCSNLLTVNLSKCPNVGNSGVIGVIQHCKGLRKLKLEKIGISDTGLAFISHHGKSVTKLVLSGLEKVTQKGFVTCSLQTGLKSLKVLVLNGCRGITDIFLASLGTSPRELKVLRLIDCDQVSDHGLQSVVDGCTSLKGLHIEKCPKITFLGLRTFLAGVCETLKTLTISRCAGMQDSALAEVALETTCTALTSLSVTYCDGVGDKCLGLIPTAFPSLEHLDLSGITGVSDDGLITFVETGGVNLISLNLRDCVNLTDEAALAIGRMCGGLQLLVLDGCMRVTDRSIGFLASHCHEIQDLDVSRCSISDSGIIAMLISIGPSLKTLSLSGCKQVTDESLSVIERMCDSLSALNLKNCSGLSRGALEKFEADMQRCDLLLP